MLNSKSSAHVKTEERRAKGKMPPLHQQSDSTSFSKLASPYLPLWEQILSLNPTAPHLDEQICSAKKDRESEREGERVRGKESVQLSAKQTGDRKVRV